MANNPVFNRIDKEASSYAGFGGTQQSQGGYGPPPQGQPHVPAGYGAQTAAQPDQLEQMYDQAPAGPARTGRLTLDDVVVKTLMLFAVLMASAGAAWYITSPEQMPGLRSPIWLVGMFGSLGLSFAIGFSKKVNVPLILVHAVLQGAFLGAISVSFASAPGYEGIVPTAVVATLSTFVGMFVGWKSGFIKVTSKSRRIFGMMAMGYLVFLLVNIGASFLGFGDGWGIYSGPLGIAISLLGVGLASYSLAIDFDSIDRGIKGGAPEKYSWLMAHGLIASLVWLYIEFLRLFAILQRD